MKRKLIGLLLILFVLGATSIAFAQVTSDGSFSFKQMLPFMQEVHPDRSQDDLEQMLESCHGPDGAGSGGNFQGAGMMGF